MKALVTGDKGFIGSHVASELKSRGYEVHGYDLVDDRDVRNLRGGSRYDLIIHCAAVVGGRRVMDWTPLEHAVNLAIDAALFQYAHRIRAGRVVYFSSSCAYPAILGAINGRKLAEGDINLAQPRWPDQLYGWTKLTGELLAQTAREAGVPVSVVRPFSVYGPRMREGFAVRGFLEQVQRRKDPVSVWGNADQVRDYIHVADVAKAVATVAEQHIDGPVNLGTGVGTSLAELVAMMSEAAGYAPTVEVNRDMPAGYPYLVADAKLLHTFCPPRMALETYLAEVLDARHGAVQGTSP